MFLLLNIARTIKNFVLFLDDRSFICGNLYDVTVSEDLLPHFNPYSETSHFLSGCTICCCFFGSLHGIISRMESFLSVYECVRFDSSSLIWVDFRACRWFQLLQLVHARGVGITAKAYESFATRAEMHSDLK